MLAHLLRQFTSPVHCQHKASFMYIARKQTLLKELSASNTSQFIFPQHLRFTSIYLAWRRTLRITTEIEVLILLYRTNKRSCINTEDVSNNSYYDMCCKLNRYLAIKEQNKKQCTEVQVNTKHGKELANF